MNENVSTKYLDGLRVIGAFTVLWFHLGFFLPGSGMGRIFFGPYAVTYFLILSGFVMSLSFFRKKKTRSVNETWVFFGRRYMRLVPTALICTLFCFAVAKWANYAIKVNELFPMDFLQNVFPEEIPSFGGAVYEGLIGLFVTPAALNPPLWTLEFELIGLFLTYILCELCYDKKWRQILYLALIVAFFFLKVNFCKLLVGLFLGDVFFNPNPSVLPVKTDWLKNKIAHYALFGVSVVMILFHTFVRRYAVVDILSLIFLMVSLFYMDGFIKKLLELKPLLWLSKHTYMVYALHWPLMYSGGCYLFLKLYGLTGKYRLSAIIMIVAVTVAVWVLSILLNKIIDGIGSLLRRREASE